MNIRRKILWLIPVILIIVFIVFDYGYLLEQGKYQVRQSTESSVTTPEPIKVVPDHLWIETLGISVPLVYPTETNEKSFQAALKNGVAHYPGTAEIGQPGNCYIFGHSSDYVWSKSSFKTAFALLPKIKPGDEITVSDHEGKAYKYKVTKTVVVSPNQTEYLAQDLNKKSLTLQTSYPLGTALKRFLAIAELVEK